MNFPGSLHGHTDYSNTRIRDSINKVSELIDYAVELGQEVIAITDHDCVSSYIKVEKHRDKVLESNSDFKVIFGNEIYLCRDGLNAENFNSEEDKYFHFILLAKDLEGNKQIREISSRAWLRSYVARGLRRVPTYYKDLKEIIFLNQGHVIGSSACLGGWLPTNILKYEKTKDDRYLVEAKRWCLSMVKLFGKGNFFLELQPSKSKEQVIVNLKLLELAKELDIPYIITCDEHYLKKEDREIHKAYLNAQEGDREVDKFYETTYLMNTEEVENYLDYLSREELDTAYKNILKIKDMCGNYSLRKPLNIPILPWKDHCVVSNKEKYFEEIANLKSFYCSDFLGDQLLAKKIIEKLESDTQLQTKEIYKEIELELNYVKESSEVNKVHWSSYLLNLQGIIDTVWESGSIVGPGRGSGVGFLLLYLLDITQINPLWETTKTYPWRFLNPSRVSVLDVDFDVSGLRREQVLQGFRNKYGEDRVSNVITFGTEKSKSAILTAARGLGIDNDVASYIAGLIPADRGMLRTLHQCFYGDKENGFSPIKSFVVEMTENYPELWKVASRIEGLVCRSGCHAGGVVFVDEPFTESASLMRSADGTIVTAFELHDLEEVSLIKYDALSVEAMDRIQTCIELLTEYGYLDEEKSLKERYQEAIGIYNLDRTSKDMWKMVWNHEIQALFQMEQQSGIQGIRLTKPESVDDLSVLNSVIRLMAQEKGGEQPLDKYKRFKEDPTQWEKEMDSFNLSKREKEILHEYLDISYGMCITQEQFMQLVQIPECGGFDLNFADRLRKSIAKKDPQGYEQIRLEFFENAKEKGLHLDFCKYVFNVLIATSRGYGFNASHTLSYSLIGLQEMNLAYNYPIIYWNTANLIVDAGGSEDVEGSKGTDYRKVAIAINKIKTGNIKTKLSLVDINKSNYDFSPDEEENQILYGLSALNKVGKEVAQTIIENRPYSGWQDFLNKTHVNKTVMISLIKSGAFDQFGERADIMREYIWSVCEPKKRVTLQNFNSLMQRNLIPQELTFQKRLFVFNKALKANCKIGDYFSLAKSNYFKFYSDFFDVDLLEPCGETIGIKESIWKKLYTDGMKPAKDYFKNNQEQILKTLNDNLFQETWDKYADGSYAHWEMDSLGMYYHAHELANVRAGMYDIQSYGSLPENPIVTRTFKRNGHEYPIYELNRIMGTVIAKDDAHSSISILTVNDGVVTVKMNRDYFAKYNRRISEIQPDGTKKIKEPGWFQKGTLVICYGVRKGDLFMCKSYKNSPSHQLYKITNVYPNGAIDMTNLRYGEME